MSSQDYWAKREAEALKNRVKDEKEYDREIRRIYNNMLDACQSEINAFYGKYAAKEGVSLSEAKKRVRELDIAAYERKAKKYVKDKDFSAKANEEMRLYNAAMKINRLEMLKANLGLELIAGHDELEKFMEGILQGRTEDELKRQAGILGKSVLGNTRRAHAIVNASFHNATFSDRIWMYQDLLKADLSKLLQSGLVQGKNPRVLARELRKTFNASTFHAERLMRTELARVQTEAQRQAFERNGFDEYEFIVNSGCCEICEGLKGKHFKVSKMMPGENAPPMHPHCRCSTAAYSDRKEYEEWLEFLEKGGTTEEYNKAKAQRAASPSTKKPHGLSAKIGGDGIPEHDEPILMQTVDYSDKAAVNQVLTDFEKSAKIEPIETACVITKNGNVYKCFGTKDRVFPDFDLKDKLIGATMSHNHPISETSYSFSGDDFALFQEYKLDVLRGCDEKYTYQLTRDAKDIDEIVDDWDAEENYWHCRVIDMAESNGVGYRRWVNE